MWITSLATYYSIKWSQDNTESLSNCYMCITPTTSIWKLKWYTIKGVVWRKIDHWYVCIKTIFMRKFQHMVMQNTFLCSRVARIFWAEGTGGSQTFPGRTQLLNSLHLYRANIHSKIFHRGMGPWRGGGREGSRGYATPPGRDLIANQVTSQKLSDCNKSTGMWGGSQVGICEWMHPLKVQCPCLLLPLHFFMIQRLETMMNPCLCGSSQEDLASLVKYRSGTVLV